MSTTAPDIVANINQGDVFYPILVVLLCLITFIILFVYKKELLVTLFSISTINGQQSVEASVNDTVLILFSVFPYKCIPVFNILT